MTPAETRHIRIRRATKKDVRLIHTLIRELSVYERLAHEMMATEKEIEKTLFGRRRYAEVIIAEYGSEPAGFALYFHNYSTFLGRPGIYLEDLFVFPHLRGNGIGKALLRQLAKIAKERECGRLEWAVLDWNEPAIRFYKSLGAKPLQDWTLFRVSGEDLERLGDLVIG